MANNLLQRYPTKPRVVILSDIAHGGDNAAALCRYLLYANQFQTEGLVACTSARMRDRLYPEAMHSILDAYQGAVDNLNRHVHPDAQYPSPILLRSLVKRGADTYGMSAVGDDIPLSEGGQLLYDRVLAPSLHPLWVLCWGGTNTLASVLLKIDAAFPPEDAHRLMSRIRVYAISDLDDSGAWIRNNFPDIFYIASVHGWNQHGMATWTGISGDRYYGFDQGGPDFSKMEQRWIHDNIQIGPLGRVYPTYSIMPEGETPTFLYLVQNGLGSPDFPGYGSWGGRYTKTDVSPNGLNGNHYGDALDRVKGLDGRLYTSNHATIWRWRDAFQDDFAARIKWTIEPDFAKANHPPVISVNGDLGLHPLRLEAEAGATIILDASGTYDLDPHDKLSFKWWHYREPTATSWPVEAEVAELVIQPLDDAQKKVRVMLPPPKKCAVDLAIHQPVAKGQLLHLILEVTDSGTPPLTTYRRILIQATNKDLKGGPKPADAVVDGKNA